MPSIKCTDTPLLNNSCSVLIKKGLVYQPSSYMFSSHDKYKKILEEIKQHLNEAASKHREILPSNPNENLPNVEPFNSVDMELLDSKRNLQSSHRNVRNYDGDQENIFESRPRMNLNSIENEDEEIDDVNDLEYTRKHKRQLSLLIDEIATPFGNDLK